MKYKVGDRVRAERDLWGKIGCVQKGTLGTVNEVDMARKIYAVDFGDSLIWCDINDFESAEILTAKEIDHILSSIDAKQGEWEEQVADICKAAYEEGYEAGRKSNAMTWTADGTFTAPSQSFLAVAMAAWAHDHEIDKKNEYDRGYKKGFDEGHEKGFFDGEKFARENPGERARQLEQAYRDGYNKACDVVMAVVKERAFDNWKYGNKTRVE